VHHASLAAACPGRDASLDALKLQRENDGLHTTIVCLRRELTDKQGHVSKLEVLLHERLAKVDELNDKLEQARAVNHRLEQECEHLAQLVGPQLNTVAASERTRDGTRY
jgi:septal ring factor EnvC (AmiA/AmiB activator)